MLALWLSISNSNKYNYSFPEVIVKSIFFYIKFITNTRTSLIKNAIADVWPSVRRKSQVITIQNLDYNGWFQYIILFEIDGRTDSVDQSTTLASAKTN